MRRLILIIAVIASALLASAQDQFERRAVRADREYAFGEWAPAATLYSLLIDQRPDSLQLYSRAIVAYDLAGDTITSINLLEDAMSHGIGLSALLETVRSDFFQAADSDAFGPYLLRMRDRFTWMQRAIDNELLRHYTFRHDGPMMVHYAQVMLRPIPDSVEYLALLAQGHLICGNLTEATEVWRHILRVDPDNIDALLYLSYATEASDPAQSAQLLRRANTLLRK